MEREMEGIISQQKTLIGKRKVGQVGINRKGSAFAG